jgi:sarcosine oxidase subunit gamma
MAEQESWLQVLPPAARFILQGDAAARTAAGRAFGVTLPEAACRAHAQGDRAALWLGPDEQLLLAPAEDAPRLTSELGAALAMTPHSLVEVSQRQVALSVRGLQADEWLASGCPLDLDLAAFPVDMCVRTLLAKSEVVLWRRSAEEYHLEVQRSFSGYVLEWLREAQRGG